MKQKAVVQRTEGIYAILEVSRSAMCDGCSKRDCNTHTCAAGALLGNTKVMTVRAINRIEAQVGETVWVETSDNKVLKYAAMVFIMPIILSCLLYLLADAITEINWIPYAACAAGFAVSFGVLGIFEQRKKQEEPELVVTGYAPVEEQTDF